MSDEVSDDFIKGYKAAPVATGKELDRLVQLEKDREAASVAEGVQDWAEFHRGAMENVKKRQSAHMISPNAFLQFGEDSAAKMVSMSKLGWVSREGFVTAEGTANGITQQAIADMLSKGE